MGKQIEIPHSESNLSSEDKALIKAYEEVKAKGGKLKLDYKKASKVFAKLQTNLF